MIGTLLPLTLLVSAPQGAGWMDSFLTGTRALERREFALAEECLEQALEFLPTHAQTAWQLACVHALQGDTSQALDWLESSLHLGGGEAALLEWDPDLSSLREEPRFIGWIERLQDREAGLAPAQPASELIERKLLVSRSTRIGLEFRRQRRIGVLMLVDDRSGEAVAVLDRAKERVLHVSISPDDRWVVTVGSDADDGFVRVFDGRSGDVVTELEGVGSSAWVQFSVEGQRMLVSNFTKERHALWEMGSWKLIRRPQKRQSGFEYYDEVGDGVSVRLERSTVGAIVRSHPSRNELWSARGDGVLLRIDAASGRSLASWHPGEARILDMCIHPTRELLATYDAKGVLRLLRTMTGELIEEVVGEVPVKVGYGFPKLSFSPDGESLLLLHSPDSLGVHEVTDGSLRWSWTQPARKSYWDAPHSWSSEGELLALKTGERELALLDAWGGEEAAPRMQTDAPIETLDFEPGSKRLWIGTAESRVHVIETPSGTEVRTLDLQDLDDFDTVELGSVSFRAEGGVAVTASSGFGVVAAWNTRSGRRLWNYEYSGGNPADLLSKFSRDGEHVYIWGQGAWSPRIVDARDGSMLLDLSGRDIYELLPLMETDLLATRWYSDLEVIETAGGRRLWLRNEFSGGGWLLRSPSGHFDARGSALDRTYVIGPKQAASYEQLAPALLDPKRVRAGAQGVRLAAAKIPVLPELYWTEETPRVLRLRAKEEPPVLNLIARCSEGVAGFEVRISGLKSVEAGVSLGENERRLSLLLQRPPTGESIDYRIRAIARSGILGRGHHLRVLSTE